MRYTVDLDPAPFNNPEFTVTDVGPLVRAFRKSVLASTLPRKDEAPPRNGAIAR
jgi:hypothetical protein